VRKFWSYVRLAIHEVSRRTRQFDSRVRHTREEQQAAAKRQQSNDSGLTVDSNEYCYELEKIVGSNN
jgi:hypothetical protein